MLHDGSVKSQHSRSSSAAVANIFVLQQPLKTKQTDSNITPMVKRLSCLPSIPCVIYVMLSKRQGFDSPSVYNFPYF